MLYNCLYGDDDHSCYHDDYIRFSLSVLLSRLKSHHYCYYHHYFIDDYFLHIAGRFTHKPTSHRGQGLGSGPAWCVPRKNDQGRSPSRVRKIGTLGQRKFSFSLETHHWISMEGLYPLNIYDKIILSKFPWISMEYLWKYEKTGIFHLWEYLWNYPLVLSNMDEQSGMEVSR